MDLKEDRPVDLEGQIVRALASAEAKAVSEERERIAKWMEENTLGVHPETREVKREMARMVRDGEYA